MSISIDGSGSITGIDQGLNVTGVLTFDDVTNVDSVGLVTARSGLHVTSGSVGVGTTNPRTDLQVGAFGSGSDSNIQLATGTSGASNILFGDGSGGTDWYKGFIKYNHSTDNLELYSTDDIIHYTGGTERLRIDSNKVNIGVNASSNPFTYLRFGASQYGAADIRPTDESSHKVGLAFYVDGTQDTTINPTEALRITSTGSVGVGTISPGHKLTVYNATPSDTGGIFVQNVNYSSGQDKPYLTVGTKGWTGATTNWNTHGFEHRIKSDSGGTPRITVDSANGELFSIENGGNIGINSTSPDEKLDVDGNIKLSGRLQVKMPADLWSQDGSFYCISDGGNELGNITHQGSYRVHITSNGYRNTNNQWQSYAINSYSGASSIGCDPTGVIIFGAETSKANGSSANITERVRIDQTRMTFAQDRRLRFAANSTWGAGLNVGGNGNSSDGTYASIAPTNGNLHLDPRAGVYGTYLSWYNGTAGTFFGSGTGAQRGRIDGSGNLTLSGSYPGSDLRLKENIETITGATDTIKALIGKTFTWKPEAGLDSYKRYGFIAQEVQQVVPDLVKAIGCHYFDADDNLIDSIDPTESDEDREAAGLTKSLTVNNEGVTPILVEAMKELIAKVETLETRISTLEGN